MKNKYVSDRMIPSVRARSRKLHSTGIWDFQTLRYLGKYGLTEQKLFLIGHIIDIRNDTARPDPAT